MTRARDLAAFVSNADGDIKFDTDTLFIDSSANRVGIGTTTPDRSLHIAGNPAQIIIEDTGGGTDDKRAALFTDSGVFEIASKNDDDSTRVNDIFCADLETGNVGIGTNSPQFDLHVHQTDSTNSLIQFTNTTTGSTSSDGLLVGIDSSEQAQVWFRENSILRFATNDTERIRIDGSGNLMVGTTTTTLTGNSGLTVQGGLTTCSQNNGVPFLINRNSSEGSLFEFREDNTTRGKILVDADRMSYCSDNGSSGGGIKPTSTSIVPTNRSGAAIDNTLDVGAASARFDDVRATNGTIQTSDENDKQDIASLTSAEMTAATAISKLFKTYKWKDKVAAKGDDARTHTGVVAQQVQTAMSDAGLDASKYAFWCSDTWWEIDIKYTDDDGKEQTKRRTYDTKDDAPEGATEHTRLGVRYPELLAFIGAATEQRLTSIESRLTALESE